MFQTRTLVVLGLGVILNTAVTQIAPAQAANLIFTEDAATVASFNFTFGRGTGTLSFGGVLTDPGLVTVQYSELRASAIAPILEFTYHATPPVAFPSPRDLVFSFDPAQDATFTFDNGNLVSIAYDPVSRPFSFHDSRRCGPYGGCISGEGMITLFLEGDRYREVTNTETTDFNWFGEPVNTYEFSGTFARGAINISNVSSIEVVPEPTTIVGTGLVLALGLVARKQQKLKHKS